jgi:hypothetical protein
MRDLLPDGLRHRLLSRAISRFGYTWAGLLPAWQSCCTIA